MSEYISKHETIEEIQRIYCTDCNSYDGAMCRACEHQDDMDIIENMAAADVQPVKRGKWVQIGEQSAKCTECNGVLKSNGVDKTGKALIFYGVYHYCPYCGVRMDGDTECQ